MMSDVTPIYFRPTRNAYGILVVSHRVNSSTLPLLSAWKKPKRNLAGTCCNYQLYLWWSAYNTDFIKKTLDVKSIHFDSAGCLTPTSHRFTKVNAVWAVACRRESDLRNPVYSQTAGGVSQASMIHVKGDVNEETFNEATWCTPPPLRTTVSWRPLKPRGDDERQCR